MTDPHLTDEALALFRYSRHRRGGAAALGAGDDDGVAALDDGHHTVGGAEVDANDLAHGVASYGSYVSR